MNQTIKLLLVFASIGAFSSAQASEIPVVYTQANFESSLHEKPATFERDAVGNFSGTTVSGRLFTQTYVATSISVRLQRFAIDDSYFYISDHGIIMALTDIEALSIYLSRVG